MENCKHVVATMAGDYIPLKMFPAKYAMYKKQVNQFNIDLKTRRGRIPTPPMQITFCDFCPNCGIKITWKHLENGDIEPCLD